MPIYMDTLIVPFVQSLNIDLVSNMMFGFDTRDKLPSQEYATMSFAFIVSGRVG